MGHDTVSSETRKEKVLRICEKLKSHNLIQEIREERCSVTCLIKDDKNSDLVMNRIRDNFEILGYPVKLIGENWVSITFEEDVEKLVDDCFLED